MARALILLSCLLLAGCTSPSARVAGVVNPVPGNLAGTYAFDARKFHGYGYFCHPFSSRLPLPDGTRVVVTQSASALPRFQYVDADGVQQTTDLASQSQAPYWTWQGGALIHGKVEWEPSWLLVWFLRHEWTGRLALDAAGNLVGTGRFRTTDWLGCLVPTGIKTYDCEYTLQRVP